MEHRHHIVPRHMGGTDDPSNVVSLPVIKHAQQHLELWAIYGCEEDLIAYRALSGQIAMSEARRLAVLAGAAKGGRISGGHPKGVPTWNKGKSVVLRAAGWNHSDEAKAKMSQRQRGRKRSAEVRAEMSRSRKGRTPWNKGVAQSDEARQKIRASTLGERNPFFGKRHSDATKEKIRAKKLGSVPWNKGKRDGA